MESAAYWDHVIDFQWHKDKPSPNWNRLSEEEQIAVLTTRVVSHCNQWSLQSVRSSAMDVATVVVVPTVETVKQKFDLPPIVTKTIASTTSQATEPAETVDDDEDEI